VSNGDPLTEISDTARLLAKLGPETDAKLTTSLEQLGICRREESLLSLVADLSHEVEVYSKLQGELGQKMHRLIRLTAQHLPGCNLATLTAVDRDWSKVVAELNRIESKALEASVKSQEPDTDEIIPKEHRTEPQPKTTAARKFRPDLSEKHARKHLNDAMESGELRFIELSPQRFIFDKRQIDMK
jgi:hypothetical protein